MRHRLVVAAAITLAFALPSSAQVSGVYSRAVPPDRSAIERLNLKTLWTVNLPIAGRKDSISQIQTLDDQIFVQTRTGLVIAIDAVTGRIQWTAQIGTGDSIPTYPLAVNSQFVYVANLTRLYSFHRYTGVTEFVTDMGAPPTCGLSADESGVYCVLAVRVGSSGANRITVYNLPRPISILPNAKAVQFDKTGKPIKESSQMNPIDTLITRYSPENAPRPNNADTFPPSTRTQSTEVPVSGVTGSRSPSISILPRVTPPYTLENDTSSPSINILQSMRQPYRMRNDFQKDIQFSPSIGTIPPSVAASLALSDLRPKEIQPPIRWEYGTTSRVEFPVTLTPLRAWLLTDGKHIMALNKVDKKVETDETLPDAVSAPPGRAGLDMYVPLGSGYLVAVEGTMGQQGSARILWRSAVGGINNRIPYVTDNMVYTQGEDSGIVCVDRKNGGIVWRSEPQVDRILAANKEFLYVRNHQGKLLVFDARRPTDAAGKLSYPLAGLDLSDFNIPVMNTASDRLLLAADNGLIVCLRDMSPKYTLPVKICPDALVNGKSASGVIVVGKDNMDKDTMQDPGMKKEPEKKEPEKN